MTVGVIVVDLEIGWHSLEQFKQLTTTSLIYALDSRIALKAMNMPSKLFIYIERNAMIVPVINSRIPTTKAPTQTFSAQL
jgi:hypothetical protein